MNRAAMVARRYQMGAELARSGASLFIVGDPLGARLSDAVRAMSRLQFETGDPMWDDLIGPAKGLRWRLMMRPQPLSRNPRLVDLCEETQRQVGRMRLFTGDDHAPLLDDLDDCLSRLAVTDPAVGIVLADTIAETGPAACFVVAGSGTAAAELEPWLATAGMHAYRPAELSSLEGLAEERDVAFCIGPPVFFPPSLVTAPAASEVTFIFPRWFTQHALPQTEIGKRGEGTIRVTAREFACGELDDPPASTLEDEPVESYRMPVPDWQEDSGHALAPSSTLRARKALLSGGWATWLDDGGDRIRTLDLTQPSGYKVVSAPLASLEPGTVLILRREAAERDLLLEQAIQMLGQRQDAVAATQAAWKQALSQRLNRLGVTAVEAELSRRGVEAAGRAQAWTEPHLTRPRDDTAFEILLDWLGIAPNPTITNANLIRSARSRAAHSFTKKLVAAAEQIDRTTLAEAGHVEFGIPGAGSAIATQILAISTQYRSIPPNDARRLVRDTSGRWLE